MLSQMEMDKMVWRHHITKLWTRWTSGSSKTVHSNPYRRVGRMTDEKTQSLVVVLILFCNHSLQLSEPKACEALIILEDTSALLLQSWDTVLPRYWKVDTGSTGSAAGLSRMG